MSEPIKPEVKPEPPIAPPKDDKSKDTDPNQAIIDNYKTEIEGLRKQIAKDGKSSTEAIKELETFKKDTVINELVANGIDLKPADLQKYSMSQLQALKDYHQAKNKDFTNFTPEAKKEGLTSVTFPSKDPVTGKWIE
jgi:hypothetical protein